MPPTLTRSTRPSKPISSWTSGPTMPEVPPMSCSSSQRSSPSSRRGRPTSPTSSTTDSSRRTRPGIPPHPPTSPTVRPFSCTTLSCTTRPDKSPISSTSAPSSRSCTPPSSSRPSLPSPTFLSIPNFIAFVSRAMTSCMSPKETQPPTTPSLVGHLSGSKPRASRLAMSSLLSLCSTPSAPCTRSSSREAAPPSSRLRTPSPSGFLTPSLSRPPLPSTKTCDIVSSLGGFTTPCSTTSAPSEPSASPTQLTSSGPKSASQSTRGSRPPPGTTSSTSPCRPQQSVRTPLTRFSSRPSHVSRTGSGLTRGPSGVWPRPPPLSPPGSQPLDSAASPSSTPTACGCSAAISSAVDSGRSCPSRVLRPASSGRPTPRASPTLSLRDLPLSAESLELWRTGALPRQLFPASSQKPSPHAGSFSALSPSRLFH
ncbi:movement protein [Switchgrass mosaic virus]|uniref:movement protein n=1 Tax=Switchgrass mosaic virus TaxID=1027869 RepID=UPI00020C1DB0|nr:movement protein [Switchgrass mosaic virus]AEE25897.3 movement protein [Switchgrass mosaic virus]